MFSEFNEVQSVTIILLKRTKVYGEEKFEVATNKFMNFRNRNYSSITASS